MTWAYNWRTVAGSVARALCFALAIGFVVMHGPWAIPVAIYKTFTLPIAPGGPLPTASSAMYYLRVENRTTEPLIVSVSQVNDVRFKRRGPYRDYISNKLGWRRYEERVVAPQDSWLAYLRSEQDPRTGYILVCARTELDPYEGQRIALYLMPWKAACYLGPGPDGKPLFSSLVIEEKDLEELIPGETATKPIRIPVR